MKSKRWDIVFKDNKRKTCLLIDMSVPTDINLSVKDCNQISKYKGPEREIEKKRHLNSGSPGYDQEGTVKHINKIPGNPSQYEIQKKKKKRKMHFTELLISLCFSVLTCGYLCTKTLFYDP